MNSMAQDNKQIPIEAAPLYRRIHFDLRERILSGQILPGEKMPSETEITRRYGISRFTAQQVYRLLVEEGLVVRKQGRGTFVRALSAERRNTRMILRLGALHTPDTPLVQAQYRFARKVAQLTGNQVEVEIFHSSTLGSGPQQLSRVQDGQQDMFGAAADWLEPFEPSWGVGNLPFLFASMAHARLFADSEVAMELRRRLLAASGLRVLADNWVRPSRVILTTRPCFEPADLAGLELRVPPIPTYRSMWQALGCIPVEVAWSDILEALRRGSVQGIDVPRDVICEEGFHRLARYVTETRHLYSRACLVISERLFKNLRSDVQEALVQAARETGESYSQQALARWQQDQEQMILEGARFISTDTRPFRARTADIFGSRPEFAHWVKAIIALQAQEEKGPGLIDRPELEPIRSSTGIGDELD